MKSPFLTCDPTLYFVTGPPWLWGNDTKANKWLVQYGERCVSSGTLFWFNCDWSLSFSLIKAWASHVLFLLNNYQRGFNPQLETAFRRWISLHSFKTVSQHLLFWSFLSRENSKVLFKYDVFNRNHSKAPFRQFRIQSDNKMSNSWIQLIKLALWEVN